jgi:hypothetical protein
VTEVPLATRVDDAFALCTLEQVLLDALDVREAFIERLDRRIEGNLESP